MMLQICLCIFVSGLNMSDKQSVESLYLTVRRYFQSCDVLNQIRLLSIVWIALGYVDDYLDLHVFWRKSLFLMFSCYVICLFFGGERGGASYFLTKMINLVSARAEKLFKSKCKIHVKLKSHNSEKKLQEEFSVMADMHLFTDSAFINVATLYTRVCTPIVFLTLKNAPKQQ